MMARSEMGNFAHRPGAFAFVVIAGISEKLWLILTLPAAEGAVFSLATTAVAQIRHAWRVAPLGRRLARGSQLK